MTQVDEWPGGDPAADGLKRMSPEEVERIIELRLNRIPLRTVAQEVGCSVNTVRLHWDRYLDEVAQERSARLERQRAEAMARLDSVATMARRAAVRAGGDVRTNPDGTTTVVVAPDLDTQRKMLNLERQSIESLARIGGYEAPRVLQLAPSIQPTEEEARQELVEMADQMGEDPAVVLALLEGGNPDAPEGD